MPRNFALPLSWKFVGEIKQLRLQNLPVKIISNASNQTYQKGGKNRKQDSINSSQKDTSEEVHAKN